MGAAATATIPIIPTISIVVLAVAWPQTIRECEKQKARATSLPAPSA